MSRRRGNFTVFCLHVDFFFPPFCVPRLIRVTRNRPAVLASGRLGNVSALKKENTRPRWTTERPRCHSPPAPNSLSAHDPKTGFPLPWSEVTVHFNRSDFLRARTRVVSTVPPFAGKSILRKGHAGQMAFSQLVWVRQSHDTNVCPLTQQGIEDGHCHRCINKQKASGRESELAFSVFVLFFFRWEKKKTFA